MLANRGQRQQRGYSGDMDTKRGTGILTVNNTGSDLRMFDDAILDAILAGGTLPEELADLITLTRVEVDGAARWIIDWA